jgi:hypothetical protein
VVGYRRLSSAAENVMDASADAPQGGLGGVRVRAGVCVVQCCLSGSGKPHGRAWGRAGAVPMDYVAGEVKLSVPHADREVRSPLKDGLGTSCDSALRAVKGRHARCRRITEAALVGGSGGLGPAGAPPQLHLSASPALGSNRQVRHGGRTNGRRPGASRWTRFPLRFLRFGNRLCARLLRWQWVTRQQREKMAELLFERFNVKGLHFVKDPVLSRWARLTGIAQPCLGVKFIRQRLLPLWAALQLCQWAGDRPCH